MKKGLVRLLALLLIPLLLTGALGCLWYDQLTAELAADYNPEQGRSFGLDQRSKGLELLRLGLRRNDLLMLGSSELDLRVPQNPQEVFPNTQLNRNVILVGGACTQCLQDMTTAGALAEELSGKQAVLVLSIQWFFGRDGIGSDEYRARFSELQFYAFFRSARVAPEQKEYLARRACQLLAGDSSFAGPRLYAWLHSGSNVFQVLGRVLFAPYFSLRYRFLQLQDAFRARTVSRQYADAPARAARSMDWNAEMLLAEEQGRAACTNNELYVADWYYSRYLAPQWEQLAGILDGVDPAVTRELEDYEQMLRVFRDADVDLYLVFMSANGWYYDYNGLDAGERAALYDALGALAEEYGFGYLDTRNLEYEPYSYYDVMHLGWKGWLYVDEQIADYFTDAA